MSVTCNDVNISSESNIKYVGVTLDQDMIGTSMGTFVVQKINGKIKFLYRKNAFYDLKKERCCVQLYFNHGIKQCIG